MKIHPGPYNGALLPGQLVVTIGQVGGESFHAMLAVDELKNAWDDFLFIAESVDPEMHAALTSDDPCELEAALVSTAGMPFNPMLVHADSDIRLAWCHYAALAAMQLLRIPRCAGGAAVLMVDGDGEPAYHDCDLLQVGARPDAEGDEACP